MPLDLGYVEADQSVQQAFDQISALFPVSGINAAYPTVTALPTYPVNGMVIHYLADATNGVIWPLKYRAASASSLKWEAAGPTALNSDDGANIRNTSSSTYQTTNAPTITVPLAGDYDVSFGAGQILNKAAATNEMQMAIHVGGTIQSKSIIDVLVQGAGSANSGGPGSKESRLTGLTATAVVDARYRSASSQSADFFAMWMQLKPVRVG